ncbi:MAG: hypothetical protein ACNA7K_02480 [Acholeplasmataceae bacterium]
MNSKLLVLVKGELTRLNKYGVTTISVLTAFLWFLLLFFIDDRDILAQMLPFVIMIDATMMSAIYVGAIMYYEKTEKTISTLLVTPVKKSDLILSKVIANTITQFSSTMLVVLVFFFVKQVEVSWLILSTILLISIVFHSLLGFVFSYDSKDFTSMLMNLMIYVFVFMLPSVLFFFGIVFKGEAFKYILLLSPAHNTLILIGAGFGAALSLEFYLALAILVSGIVLGYRYYIYPKFKTYAIKESGV